MTDAGVDVPSLTPSPLAFDGSVTFSPNGSSLSTQQPLPVYTESRQEGEACELGYLCENDLKINCTVLQGLPIAAGFGDIHAGLSCPANVSTYRNCPAGFYCPTPEAVVPCPSGMYCPHKTAMPEVKCNQCGEQSQQLVREQYGYTILIIYFVLVILYIVWIIIKRRNKERVDKLVELAERRMTSIRLETFKRSEREKLEKIKPRLELISARVKTVREEQAKADAENGIKENFSFASSILPSKFKSESVAVHSDGSIKFDARRLFDAIDTDGNHVLSYAELNRILELDTVSLQEFVRRMNERGGVSADCKVISRQVFVRHFVDVLAEASSFGPTQEEAALLFDDIADQGTDKRGEIQPEQLYTSSLSKFLSDSQINNLAIRLRKQQPEESTRSARSLRDLMDEKHDKRRGIDRETFIANYPSALREIVTDPDPSPILSRRNDTLPDSHRGVDIAFEDLSLAVSVGGVAIKVVDNVTGRLRAGTMTALMGGSGAGKTSLLNALCGRAFYGETTGTIKVNGHLSSIEEHRSAVGFVPQDDIVYAELTVKENFMYAAKFQLEAGTSLEDIEDLADATLANLGLSRVANMIVGDVHRRGVSGGEKKRVNIGLELMSRPQALFLDEPTSGLDSSSALLVMRSLRALVENQGVTVCSVIHQPRKNIFDLFDDLILLGVGGKVVFNGSTSAARKYVEILGYRLPAGDSVADWLIDVSSGLLEPEENPTETDERQDKEEGAEVAYSSRNVPNAGPSSNQVEHEFEEAKIRRETLYSSWNEHFGDLSEEEKSAYSAPAPYDLPESVKRPSFSKQLLVNIRRNFLVTKRNAFSKMVDTFLIVGAVVLISAFEGVVEVTLPVQPDVSFDAITSGDPQLLATQLPELFEFAILGTNKLQEYALKTGVISAVLIGLTAAKTITDKRLEFFREAASGYDVNAYFVAVNISSSIEHSIQSCLAASTAFWLRDSFAKWYSYYISFLMLSWLCVSWALLLPLLVPPKSVVLVTGFFMAFFGLLFSGGLSPVKYEDIYDDNALLSAFSGFVSPTRYFIEGLTVAEHRCLPEQTGFTQTEGSINFPTDLNSFAILSLAQNDESVREQMWSGWYWGVLPALLVGLTIRVAAGGVIHISDRSQQAKKPLRDEMKAEKTLKGRSACSGLRATVAVFLVVLVSLFSLSIWSILRET